MIKETITYNGYDGVEYTEDFYFNLTAAEILKLESSVKGGLSEGLKKMIAEEDASGVIATIEELVQRSFGKRVGKGFIKKTEDLEEFMSTEAYSNLLMKLLSDENAASKFIKGTIPADLAAKIAEEEAKQALEAPENS